MCVLDQLHLVSYAYFSCDYKNSEINVKQKYIETRRVLSETKAIMSPPHVIGWKHVLLIGRWYYKLELLPKVIKCYRLFPNFSNGSRDTRTFVIITLTLNFHLEVTLVNHALCTSTWYFTCVPSHFKMSQTLQEL